MQELLKRMPGLEAVHHAVVITDTAGIVTYWNPAAGALLGWSSEEAVGRPLADLAVVDLQPAELIERVVADSEWTGEIAVRRRQGTAFLARVHQVSLTDPLGTVDGILRLISDVTDETWARRRELEDGQRARRALAAAAVGSWQVDITTGIAVWDATMERLFGLEPGTFAGSREAWRDLIHPADREWAIEEIRRATTSGTRALDLEYRVSVAGAPDRWVKVIGRTFTDRTGTVTQLTGVAFDITERRHADEERAAFLASERARRDRFTLLAEASAAFAEAVDDADIIRVVGTLAVPRLADWFAIDMATATGITTVAAVHSDPTKRDAVARLADTSGARDGVLPDVPAVIAEGKPRLLPIVDPSAWPVVRAQPAYAATLDSVGLRSVMIVPLTARNRTFGAMTFGIGDSNLSYSNDDLTLVEDLARRAAVSIDSARLLADRTHVARVLQRSLLPPELPDVPGATVAARYRAAVAGSDIGGDFYDVFQTGDDRWTLVLGDVSGKGTDAAVLTGLARHTLRAAAMRAADPSEVLSALNHAVVAPEYGERFVTLAYVQMAIDGGRADLLVSSAGHPSPLVLRADGTLEELTQVGGILGLFEDVEIVEEAVTLQPGDLLVLYTDGVLEARDSTGAFYGDARLRDLLAQLHGASADQVAAAIEDAVLQFQDDTPRDDIAILVAGIGDTYAVASPGAVGP